MHYVIKIFKANGESMSKQELESVYLSDLQFRPLKKRKEIIDGEVHIEGHHSPVIIHAMIPVMDYGYVWVTADNYGEGYSRTQGEINFIREAVISRLAEIKMILYSYEGPLSIETSTHIDAAEEYFNLAEKKQGKMACELYHRALSHGIWGAELVLLDKARYYKRKNPVLMVGGNAFKYKVSSEFAEYFERAFNFATLPFYLLHALKEEERGYPHYERVDEILSWCKEKGIIPKGHPLWWNHPAGMPNWLKEADWETMKKECIRIVRRSVERYRGDIDIWDVINEAHDWANLNPLSQEQIIEITRIACETAREANPDAVLIVNNCLPFGEYVVQGLKACPYNNLREERILFSPYTYIESLIENNVTFDVIGIQLYFPARDMVTIFRLLDEYMKFGKPIHITELGVSSGDSHLDWAEQNSKRSRWPLPHLYGMGIWHSEWEWSEKIQADWLEWFYTIAYTKEQIEALTWWDIQDPGYIPSGGLINENGIPKEAYYRLLEFRKLKLKS